MRRGLMNWRSWADPFPVPAFSVTNGEALTEPISLSNAFMTNKTPSGTKKHHESAKRGTRKTSKMLSFFFFFLLQTGWLNIA